MTTKENILNILRKNKGAFLKYGVINIGLFGSYLANKQTKNSDIDLYIEFNPNKESFDNLMAIYDLLENLFQNEKIQIVTNNGLSKYIGPRILKELIYS